MSKTLSYPRPKSRSSDDTGAYLGYRNTYGSITHKYAPAIAANTSTESLVSFAHKQSHGGVYKEGGPFACSKYFQSAGAIQLSVGAGSQWYHGKFRATNAGMPGFATALAEAEGDVSSYGASGWSKFCPGKPKVNAAQFIGEMKDLPRMLKQTARRFKEIGSKRGRFDSNRFQRAGEDYLNVQFGWLPFVSDIRKMYALSHTIENELQKVRNSNGKWLTRGGSVSSTESTGGSWGGTGVCRMTPVLSSKQMGPTSQQTWSGESYNSRRVWFKGRFRYYIPQSEMNSPAYRWNMMRKLYGLSLTPSLIYELTPWSWLIDYFSNAGDIFENISGGYVDAVAKYAYIMGTTVIGQRQSCSFLPQGHASLKTMTLVRERVYKTRKAASPFGFAFDQDDLSGRQLAILTALGLSRFG